MLSDLLTYIYIYIYITKLTKTELKYWNLNITWKNLTTQNFTQFYSSLTLKQSWNQFFLPMLQLVLSLT